MNYELRRELSSLSEKIKIAQRSRNYDAVLINNIEAMLVKLGDLREKLKEEYIREPSGSVREEQILAEAESIRQWKEYLLTSLSDERRKTISPYEPVSGREYRKNVVATTACVVAGVSLLAACSVIAGPSIKESFTNTKAFIATKQSKNSEETKDSKEESSQVTIDDIEDISQMTMKEKIARKPAYTDPTDEKQVKAMVEWYYDSFFKEKFKNLPTAAKDSVSEVTFANVFPVASGYETLYTDFNSSDVIEYDEILIRFFEHYLSLENATGEVDYVPFQYMYPDGSYDQKCAAEVDAILEQLIPAMKKQDNVAFEIYAKMYGELLLHQYLYPDLTGEHYNARTGASSGSRIHLWSRAYAEYTEKIMPYAMQHDIDICLELCKEFTSGKPVVIPMSESMAMLDQTYMRQWDAVLARAGITADDYEDFGIADTERSMPQVLTEDAINHYKGMKLELTNKNS